MGLNIYKFDKEFRPHLGYHFEIVFEDDIRAIAKTVKLPTIEIKDDDSKRFYGNTALSLPIYNFSSKQIEITFLLDESLALLGFLGDKFNFIQAQPHNNIYFTIIEYKDDLSTEVKKLKYGCRLLEMTPPEFSNTGSPGFAEMTATFIVDSISEEKNEDGSKELDKDTFTSITRSASPAGAQNLQPFKSSGDEKTYKDEEKKEQNYKTQKAKDFDIKMQEQYQKDVNQYTFADTPKSTPPTVPEQKKEDQKEEFEDKTTPNESNEKSIDTSTPTDDNPTKEELIDGYENTGRKTSGDTTPSEGVDTSKSADQTGGQSAADAYAAAKAKRDAEEAAKKQTPPSEGTNTTKPGEKDATGPNANNSPEGSNTTKPTDGVNTSSKYTDREDELAYQMMRGNVGNGDPRKINAKSLGYSDSEIKNAQAIVNEKKWNELKARHDERVKNGTASDEKPTVPPSNGTNTREPSGSGQPTQSNGQNSGGSAANDAAAKAKAEADKKNSTPPVESTKPAEPTKKETPTEAPKKEDPKKEEPKKEEPKKETPKKDSETKQEPKKDDKKEDKPKDPPSKAVDAKTELDNEMNKAKKEKNFAKYLAAYAAQEDVKNGVSKNSLGGGYSVGIHAINNDYSLSEKEKEKLRKELETQYKSYMQKYGK